jgi:hypothetical protein
VDQPVATEGSRVGHVLTSGLEGRTISDLLPVKRRRITIS